MEAKISGQLLSNALRMTTRVVRYPLGAAGWNFDEGRLVIEWAGSSHAFPGTGRGQGTVRVPDREMRRLASMPGWRKPVVIRYADGLLNIASFAFSAVGRPGCEPGFVPQLVDANPSLEHFVALPFVHAPEVIDAAELTEAVSRATTERVERTDRAARTLRPLGVDPAALREWVEEHLRARANRG